MNPRRLEYPDVDAALVEFLAGRLKGVPVSTRVPRKRPPAFVRARTITPAAPREAGVPLTEPTVLVEAWAPTDEGARDLAGRAWTEVADAWGEWLSESLGVWCYGSDVAGIIEVPDPDTETPRFQFTANITLNLREKD